MNELRHVFPHGRRVLPAAAPLIGVLLLLFLNKPLGAQSPKPGAVTPLSAAKFEADGDVKCLTSALENGNPDTGPSTFLLKAPPGCVVPKHLHSAEEQLIVVRGIVSTGMEGMQAQNLGPGGFAMMPGKAIHWFTCTAKQECLMFVTFDRKYDITWIKEK